MTRFYFALALSLLTCSSLHAISEGASLFKRDEPKQHIQVNNRVLAKVNGKAISVIDLMKKMDVLFYREFPQYSSIVEARYQYYQANWQSILSEMVDKELIIADAEEHKVPTSAGDVRQEMEASFGPNILSNLNSIGMTYDEAWKIVESDLLIQRMIFVRVNAKVLQQVTPQEVRNAYEEYIASNVNPSTWTYQVISFRDQDSSNSAQTAALAHQWLVDDLLPIAELCDRLKGIGGDTAKCSVAVSEELQHNEKELSDAYRQALEPLSVGTYSSPIAQQSRNGSTAYRIFVLKEFKPGGVPAYNEVAAQLKSELFQKVAAKETMAYFARLRKDFDTQLQIPEGFAPFTLL